jgi:predicted nucleic acid-binding protein
LWEEAGDLGFFLARKGVTAKTLDLLIATYAMSHGVPVLAFDRDYADMRAAGVKLLLEMP